MKIGGEQKDTSILGQLLVLHARFPVLVHLGDVHVKLCDTLLQRLLVVRVPLLSANQLVHLPILV